MWLSGSYIWLLINSSGVWLDAVERAQSYGSKSLPRDARREPLGQDTPVNNHHAVNNHQSHRYELPLNVILCLSPYLFLLSLSLSPYLPPLSQGYGYGLRLVTQFAVHIFVVVSCNGLVSVTDVTTSILCRVSEVLLVPPELLQES